MKKDIIVPMIAAAFFAASVVAPAFATDADGTTAGTDATSRGLVDRQQPGFDPSKGLPDIDFPDRLPSADTIAERLRNLDIETILDRDDVATNPPGEPIELPDLERFPESEPVELPDLERLPEVDPVEPADQPDAVEEPEDGPDAPEEPKDEPDVEDAPEANGELNGPRVPVKEIVTETKAEKARILADHGGDRRAAKAELKAAQMRMVARIKANNRSRDKGKR